MTAVGDVEVNFLVSSISSTSVATSSQSLELDIRATYCRDIQVVGGDTCPSLATRCGITLANFNKYNSADTTFCNNLKVKQYVCCSTGTLQDHRPQPDANGNCYTYTTKAQDGCWAIGDVFGITEADIEKYNKKTWGWAGCGSGMGVGQVICLSSGNPPFRSSLDGATCGPQVPGTVKPAAGTDWSSMNPCPLNACCDVWGFCGVTDEFCTPTPADSGAPGTAKPNTNGCISNCGTKITNNDVAPSEFRKVGYFEAWNSERSCLNMDITDMPTGRITHIHFAFATVTKDFDVSVEAVKDQFQKYKDLKTNAKKIVSFGGWDFSTGENTFQLFRDATNAANRDTFVTNAVAFLKENELDGLDFDWEYPGAPDIPGVPPGSPAEANNYLEFLNKLKAKMPAGKSISVALPASFWYLQTYPVVWMQYFVDYFVYMTYDLHGQWGKLSPPPFRRQGFPFEHYH